MEHDAVGDDGAPAYLMSASTPQAPSGTNLQFSAASRSSAAAYFEDTYGVGPVDACLDDAEAPSWDAAICGDGIVDAGEACDVGLFIEDACCRGDCSLEPGCECAAADACCDGGLFAAAGTEEYFDGGRVAGQCYAGDCVSLEDSCVDLEMDDEPAVYPRRALGLRSALCSNKEAAPPVHQPGPRRARQHALRRRRRVLAVGFRRASP
ncbi:metalloendopeptidase [Aureococcus anophagefferens]|nr:metalloendopeptidase [Aureococcus anophagefferens]